MKKFLVLSIAAIISIGMTACGGSSAPATGSDEGQSAEAPAVQSGEYIDGTYTSEMFFEGDDGYQDNVTVVISGGKIASVEWNGIPVDGGDDKRTASENGAYEIADWHEQAAKMEAKVVETQDPYAIPLNDDGTTDAVPGVTIRVDDFLDMVSAALDEAHPEED